MSFKSNATGVSTGSKNFMALNKDRARDYNPFRPQMRCDTLDEQSKSRLDRLTEDIEENLDDFIKKKEEYYAIEIEKSQFGEKQSDPDNAYLYSKDDVERIERINESLRKVAPMLPPAEDDIGLEMKHFDHSKFVGAGPSNKFDDKQSLRSLPMSTATRKSNITMLTH